MLIVEKQIVWLVTNIYLYTSTGRIETTIYGKEQDAIDEFSQRIQKALPIDYPVLSLEHDIALGIANGSYQYQEGENIVVVALDKDVVN